MFEFYRSVNRRKFITLLAGALLNFGNSPVKRARSPDKKTAENKQLITLFLSGDVMTGRGIDQALPHSVDPKLHESYVKDARYYLEIAEQRSGNIPDPLSFDYIWGDALQVLDNIDPDLRIINLETAVTNSSEYSQNKSIHYRMHPKNASLLTNAKIDICVLANNHMLDWGCRGLRQTIQTLNNNGIATVGAGVDAKSALQPAVIELTERRLLIFSYATVDSGIPSSWSAGEDRAGINLLEKLDAETAEKVISDINSFRKGTDSVVTSIHWGGNWGYEIPKAQREFAHSLIDAGVDLIHGHSSHHPKAIEVYNERLILYGCGDLINDYEGISGYESFRDDLTLLYFTTLNANGSLHSLQMAPMKIKKFRLSYANEQDTKWLVDRLNSGCQQLNTEIHPTNNHLELYW